MLNNLDDKRSVELFRSMSTIRQFDNLATSLSLEGVLLGPVHSYAGQEAVATGICSQLTREDVISSTHRGHGHFLAKGGLPRSILGELFGLPHGANQGYGGSMHVCDLSLGIYGANGIVGAGVPIACGSALASKVDGEQSITVAFFGDGAINQGVVLESFNLACTWALPIVFVCENNGYAATVSSKKTTSGSLTKRAEAFGLDSIEIDGQDVIGVYDAFGMIRENMRKEQRPFFINAITYRYEGHFSTEHKRGFKYRSDEEITAWRLRDPLEILRRKYPHLISEFEDVEEEVRKTLDECLLEIQDPTKSLGENAVRQLLTQ